jgi:hypothetical protein
MRTRIITFNTPPSRISHRRFAPHGRETLIDAAIVFRITRRRVTFRDKKTCRIPKTTKNERIRV